MNEEQRTITIDGTTMNVEEWKAFRKYLRENPVEAYRRLVGFGSDWTATRMNDFQRGFVAGRCSKADDSE